MIDNKKYYEFFGRDLIWSYRGIVDNQIIGLFIEFLDAYALDGALRRRIVSLFIELSHNIYHYSGERVQRADKDVGVGVLALEKKNADYTIISGNLIKKSDQQYLKDRCMKINQLGREELRGFKRHNRKAVLKEKTGANVGLIQAALIANGKLDYDFFDMGDDECAWFLLKIRLNNN